MGIVKIRVAVVVIVITRVAVVVIVITIPQMLENVNQIMIVLLIFNKRVGKEIF